MMCNMGIGGGIFSIPFPNVAVGRFVCSILMKTLTEV